MERDAKITAALLAFAATANPQGLFPTIVPEAADLNARDPYAFSIAICLDRGTKADIIWTIPYYMLHDLGHLDPLLIDAMTMDDLAAMFRRLPHRPRYVDAAPRTIKELTHIVVHDCAGDASRIWSGKHASEVNRTFRSIYGVGVGIANMAVLLIESGWGIQFPDHDRSGMDIKPDVHTMRVLYRLGVADSQSEQSAIAAARRLSPAFPGAIDGALWWIGRQKCHPSEPDCSHCPVSSSCPRRL